ncbi:kinase-like domain-containing protein [Gigaspora rosea]|uniref:Kinase-like domain-containing protein n=1 Tax=Gigaspora rosea TaxID=44941 RepID=A0A397U8T9_9GLOM|nr:kinase-like domain-containing protein [Gigaspora rosea]
MGSLRKNIFSVANMEWKDKLTLLQCIASDLQIIHSQGLIHRDLHSGNILLDDLKSAYITDLGLTISINNALKTKNDGVYGVLPYVAPEVLINGHYTTPSDIYSFGIILWEILYGTSVPFDEAYESQLKTDVCFHDLRPAIIMDTPQCYISLMKQCWERNPENRITATKICEILKEWQSDENILLELIKSDEILKNIDNTRIQSYSYGINKDKNTNSEGIHYSGSTSSTDDNYKSRHTSFYQDDTQDELEIP